METQVVVVIGAGGIGIAIARRQGFGKHVLLADFNQELLEKAAKELEVASYKVSTQHVDVSYRESGALASECSFRSRQRRPGRQHRWRIAQYGSARTGVGCRPVRQRRCV
ncbi:MAG: hypothetical protein QOE55_5703 [Acidobacteriaceae bacterium]|jgi:NAD(P)-dependent dehydrogenase (short-subunit alcohol dehydrogenase family)|nr:hypothetical protein [Acidobacteriaceae bacterium]